MTELGMPEEQQQDNTHESNLTMAKAILKARRDSDPRDVFWAEKYLRRADPNSRECIVWSA